MFKSIWQLMEAALTVPWDVSFLVPDGSLAWVLMVLNQQYENFARQPHQHA